MSQVYAKTIKLVNLTDIKLNPKNRNKHPEEQIERLAKIIEQTGFRRPATISNQSGFLVCGEGRYLAAQKLGLPSIPVMFQDYENEAQEFADSIADNAIDKWADLDTSGVIDDAKQFEDFDMDLLGVKGLDEIPVTKNTSAEMDIQSFDNFQHQCPSCGFEWNDNGTT